MKKEYIASAVNKPADATAITSPDEILIRPDEMSW